MTFGLLLSSTILRLHTIDATFLHGFTGTNMRIWEFSALHKEDFNPQQQECYGHQNQYDKKRIKPLHSDCKYKLFFLIHQIMRFMRIFLPTNHLLPNFLWYLCQQKRTMKNHRTLTNKI